MLTSHAGALIPHHDSGPPPSCQNFTHFIRVGASSGYYTQNFPDPEVFHASKGVSTNGNDFSLTPTTQVPVAISQSAAYGFEPNGHPEMTITLENVAATGKTTNDDSNFLFPWETDPTILTTESDICSIVTDWANSAPLLAVGESISHDVDDGVEVYIAVFGAACNQNDFGFVEDLSFGSFGQAYSFTLKIGQTTTNCQVYQCECTISPVYGNATVFTMTRLPDIGTYLPSCWISPPPPPPPPPPSATIWPGAISATLSFSSPGPTSYNVGRGTTSTVAVPGGYFRTVTFNPASPSLVPGTNYFLNNTWTWVGAGPNVYYISNPNTTTGLVYQDANWQSIQSTPLLVATNSDHYMYYGDQYNTIVGYPATVQGSVTGGWNGSDYTTTGTMTYYTPESGAGPTNSWIEQVRDGGANQISWNPVLVNPLTGGTKQYTFLQWYWPFSFFLQRVQSPVAIFTRSDQTPLIFTYNTALGGTSVRIPIYNSTDFYSQGEIAVIDWGDGTIDNYAFSLVSGPPFDDGLGGAKHTYTTPGVYNISITGIVKRLTLQNYYDTSYTWGTSAPGFTHVVQWGDVGLTSASFMGMTNLISVPSTLPSTFTNLSFMFKDTGYNGTEVVNWDVTNVTSMTAMFENAINFNQDLTGWCVGAFYSEPSDFSTNSALQSTNKPIWGYCPGSIPVADFGSYVTVGYAPLEVNFYSTSTGYPIDFLWDFKNDGTATGTGEDTSYIYTVPGTYSVKLTASNPTANSTIVKSDYITVYNYPYSAWNIVTTGGYITFSNNDLTFTAAADMEGETPTALGTYTVQITDKVMFSVTQNVYGNEQIAVGLAYAPYFNQYRYLGRSAYSIGFYDAGYRYGPAYQSGLPTFQSDNQIIDLAVDRTNNAVWIRVDGGNWNNNPAANPATNTGGISLGSSMNGLPLNFGATYYSSGGKQEQMTLNSTSAYAVPAGFTFIVAGQNPPP